MTPWAMTMRAIIVDFGMGNVASIANMIRKAGGHAELSSSPDVVESSDRLILPGVGAFDQGVSQLRETGLDIAIKRAAERGASLLGICLGMQLMLDSSDEGSLPGLGLVPGTVRRFPSGPGLKIPHMGWNTLHITRNSTLFELDVEEQRFYFVHSYYVSPRDQADVSAETSYGLSFASAFERGNLLGVQFHPEKSHRFGMKLFSRFLGR